MSLTYSVRHFLGSSTNSVRYFLDSLTNSARYFLDSLTNSARWSLKKISSFSEVYFECSLGYIFRRSINGKDCMVQ